MLLAVHLFLTQWQVSSNSLLCFRHRRHYSLSRSCIFFSLLTYCLLPPLESKLQESSPLLYCFVFTNVPPTPPWCLACPGYHMDEVVDEGGWCWKHPQKWHVRNIKRDHFKFSPNTSPAPCSLVMRVLPHDPHPPSSAPPPCTGCSPLLLEVGLIPQK